MDGCVDKANSVPETNPAAISLHFFQNYINELKYSTKEDKYILYTLCSIFHIKIASRISKPRIKNIHYFYKYNEIFNFRRLAFCQCINFHQYMGINCVFWTFWTSNIHFRNILRGFQIQRKILRNLFRTEKNFDKHLTIKVALGTQVPVYWTMRHNRRHKKKMRVLSLFPCDSITANPSGVIDADASRGRNR